MSEILNDREIRKQRKKELYELFKTDRINCKNICQYIFGENGFSEDAISTTNNYPLYFKNIMSLAFFFAYACYRKDADSEESEAEGLSKSNSKRIINSLHNTFTKYPVTFDLIRFVLTDIQFELAQGSNSELKDMFVNMCNDMSDFSFNPYLKEIAEYSKSPSRYQGSKNELMKLLFDLLSKMTFLEDYKLESTGTDQFIFIRKKNIQRDKYGELDLLHLFFRDDERYLGGIYHLFSADCSGSFPESDNSTDRFTLALRYFTPDEERSLTFHIPDEDEKPCHLKDRDPGEVFSEITGQEAFESGAFSSKKNSDKIDLVHTVNYKYTKDLALAISDAISSNAGSKELVYNRFHKDYPYIFTVADKQITSYDDESLDWDTVVIMLLIEASPTKVLEFLIRKNKQFFYDIVKNLYKRFYDQEHLEAFGKKDKALENEVKTIAKEKLIVGEAEGFGKITPKDENELPNKLFTKAAAMFIISNLSKLQDSEAEENLIYTGNLDGNISLLQRISESDEEREKKIRYSSIILGETIKHIMCFYSGLFEYGKAKRLFDIISSERSMSQFELFDYQHKFEEAFISAAKDEYSKMSEKPELKIDPAKKTKELVNASLKLFERFITFCEKCSLSNNAVSNYHKELYDAIGRHEISNIKVLKRRYKMLKNNFTEDDGITDENKFLKDAIDTLEFLKTGSFSDTAIDSDLFNAVYPFTAVFKKGKENSDGYKTITFSLNIDIDENNAPDFQMDVNVLSEFTFDRNEVFYCLPNVLRSNAKWWIDPVMISFKEFNNIFSKKGRSE